MTTDTDNRATEIVDRISELLAPALSVETSHSRAMKALATARYSDGCTPDCVGNQCLDARAAHVEDAVDDSGTDWLYVGSRCSGETGELFRAVAYAVRTLIVDRLDDIDRDAHPTDRREIRKTIDHAIELARNEAA